jgi:hypothetical protein
MSCLLVFAGPNQGNKGIIISASLLLPLDNKQGLQKDVLLSFGE